MNPKDISIEDFNYELPEERIALMPSEERGMSKLLVWNKGEIETTSFASIGHYLSAEYHLMVNETKVIPARLQFRKPTGGVIEIFCLDPVGADHQLAMTSKSTVRWRCLIGGAKKWKEGPLSRELAIDGVNVVLEVYNEGQVEGDYVVAFVWNNNQFSFSEVLSAVGEIPLPPYIGREVQKSDEDRYQTVFAKDEGSVAAPTAGLHFTDEILQGLQNRGVNVSQLTLHVSSGTFKPVQAAKMEDHPMHAEYFTVSTDIIKNLMTGSGKKWLPVGTTSMRTLESLYWIGAKLVANGEMAVLDLQQWDCYTLPAISLEESMAALLAYAEGRGTHRLQGKTALLIAPGYELRVCCGLITNFHLPKSTLMLLVAAVVGSDWRRIYNCALDNDFKFLSYGDSSLLLAR